MSLKIKKEFMEKVKSGELWKESKELRQKAFGDYIQSIADEIFTKEDCEELGG